MEIYAAGPRLTEIVAVVGKIGNMRAQVVKTATAADVQYIPNVLGEYVVIHHKSYRGPVTLHICAKNDNKQLLHARSYEVVKQKILNGATAYIYAIRNGRLDDADAIIDVLRLPKYKCILFTVPTELCAAIYRKNQTIIESYEKMNTNKETAQEDVSIPDYFCSTVRADKIEILAIIISMAAGALTGKITRTVETVAIVGKVGEMRTQTFKMEEFMGVQYIQGLTGYYVVIHYRSQRGPMALYICAEDNKRSKLHSGRYEIVKRKILNGATAYIYEVHNDNVAIIDVLRLPKYQFMLKWLSPELRARLYRENQTMMEGYEKMNTDKEPVQEDDSIPDYF